MYQPRHHARGFNHYKRNTKESNRNALVVGYYLKVPCRLELFKPWGTERKERSSGSLPSITLLSARVARLEAKPRVVN